MTGSKALVGYTGFVGGNIRNQHQFDSLYDANNIEEMKGHTFDIIVCAAAPGVKWLANQKPEEDLSSIKRLIEALSEVKAKKFVLISTIDVYPLAQEVDEDSPIDGKNLEPYGRNRRMLEEFVMSTFDYTIVRLPALFGMGLKKNIIYDYIHKISTQIPKDNSYQFYYLANIWKDIVIALENKLQIINFATEPISFKELEKEIFGQDFFSDSPKKAMQYDMHTKYSSLWEKEGMYLYYKEKIIEDLKKFITSQC